MISPLRKKKGPDLVAAGKYGSEWSVVGAYCGGSFPCLLSQMTQELLQPADFSKTHRSWSFFKNQNLQRNLQRDEAAERQLGALAAFFCPPVLRLLWCSDHLQVIYQRAPARGRELGDLGLQAKARIELGNAGISPAENFHFADEAAKRLNRQDLRSQAGSGAQRVSLRSPRC